MIMSNALVCHELYELYDVDDDITNSRRSSLGISTNRDFYNQYKKSSDKPLCWDCALFRVLGYTGKYDDKRNGYFPIV